MMSTVLARTYTRQFLEGTCKVGRVPIAKLVGDIDDFLISVLQKSRRDVEACVLDQLRVVRIVLSESALQRSHAEARYLGGELNRRVAVFKVWNEHAFQ